MGLFIAHNHPKFVHDDDGDDISPNKHHSRIFTTLMILRVDTSPTILHKSCQYKCTNQHQMHHLNDFWRSFAIHSFFLRRETERELPTIQVNECRVSQLPIQ